MEKCKGCKFYGTNTHTCDYMLCTRKPRNCSVDMCDKREKLVTTRRSAFNGTISCRGNNLPRDLIPKARALYDKGLLDTEIAAALHTSVTKVMHWREKNLLESNAEKLLAGAL